MRDALYETNAAIALMGEDFVAAIFYRVTSWGDRRPVWSTMLSPPDPIEWVIERITLQRAFIDETTRKWALGPAFEATGELFSVLAALAVVVNEVSERVHAEREQRHHRGVRYVA